MKVKELIGELMELDPNAIVVGDTSDHCYHQQCEVCGEGFAHIGKYGEWCQFGDEDTIKKTKIVQILFYS